jgi:hypothetical protein
VSQSSSARGRDEPGGRDLDEEIRALIAGYQELHKTDERVRRIGRRAYTGRPAADGESNSEGGSGEGDDG